MNYQFLMTLSITELVTYPDDDNDDVEEHILLNEILQEVEVHFPMKQIYERYLDDPVNTGDVLMYKSNVRATDYIIIDTYKEPYDQIDLVRFGAQVSGNKIIKTRERFRKLYDQCGVHIRYQEGQGILNEISNPRLYPREIIIDHYTYHQKLKIFQ